MEDAKAALGAKGLLAVAEGGMPAAALCIIDVPLDDLPELPADHRDAGRRMEKRIQVITQNRANAMKRRIATFEAWTEDGDSERVRYLYASEKETVRCRRELLQRFREERVEIDLSAAIDDDDVFDADLVNDVEVANAIESDDATSETTDAASIEPPGEDYVMLVPPMPVEDDCDFMSSLPDPDDVPGNLGILCADTALESGEEEEDFFDELRDWVWKDGCATQCV